MTLRARLFVNCCLGLLFVFAAAAPGCKTTEECRSGTVLLRIACPTNVEGTQKFAVFYTKPGEAEQPIEPPVAAVCPQTNLEVSVESYDKLVEAGAIDFRIVALGTEGRELDSRRVQVPVKGSCVSALVTTAGTDGGTNSPDAPSFVPPVCMAGYAHCSTSDLDFCETDIGTPEHCGSCNTACSAVKPNCSNKGGVYECSATCEGGAPDQCGLKCVDLKTDLQNCGICLSACSFPNAEATCEEGKCKQAKCLANFADCTEAPGCETPLGTDTNCGGCADACAVAGAVSSCVSGKCSAPVCMPARGNCDTTKPDCETELGTQQNCTACGAACGSEAPVCASAAGASSCVLNCTAGAPDKCGSQCVNTQNDVNNCGRCGEKCSFPNAGATCEQGKCKQGACNSNYADCSDSAPGCETALGTDSNCSACGDACPVLNGTSSCNAKKCTDQVCNRGWASCDNQRGCETQLGTVSKCGSCNESCGEPTPVCGGSGSTFSCVSNCTASAPDKCGTQCVDKKSDVNNCGMCSRQCTYPNAGASCSNSDCKQGQCLSGYADCTGAAGCETTIGVNDGCSLSGAQECKLGRLACAGGSGTCTAVGDKPDGTSCSAGACKGGVCCGSPGQCKTAVDFCAADGSAVECKMVNGCLTQTAISACNGECDKCSGGTCGDACTTLELVYQTPISGSVTFTDNSPSGPKEYSVRIGGSLSVGSGFGLGEARGFLSFDLTALGGGRQIKSATLGLNDVRYFIGATNPFTACGPLWLFGVDYGANLDATAEEFDSAASWQREVASAPASAFQINVLQPVTASYSLAATKAQFRLRFLNCFKSGNARMEIPAGSIKLTVRSRLP